MVYEPFTEENDELELSEGGDFISEYPNQWAVLLDKGYQVATQPVLAIIPEKKPPQGILSKAGLDYNRLVSSDMILVENYFCRLCGLWTLFSTK